MASYSPVSTLLIEVLQIFRYRLHAGNAWTAEEIWQEVRGGNKRLDFYLDKRFYRERILGSNFNTPQQWLTALLEDLSDLGLVAQAETREESSGFPRWRLGESWRPPEPPLGGGDGGRGRVGPGANGDDGENGGGGLREALGHPVLLALPQGDFDELVDGLFEEVQP